MILMDDFPDSRGKHTVKYKYSRTSILGPWNLVRDRGSVSQWGLIIAPGQVA